MEQTIKRRNIYLDLFKYFLALLVISVHTVGWPFNDLNRVAVIMFFMLTGFFTYTSNPSKELIKAKKLILRSSIYMMIALVIYFIYDMILILTHELPLDQYLNLFTLKRSYIDFFAYTMVPRYESLWYLVAMFFVSIIHFFIVRFRITYIYKWLIAIILLLVFVLVYAVYPSLPNFDVKYLRNAYLTGIPAFGTGFLLNKANQKGTFNYPNIFNLVIGTIFFFLQLVEMQIRFKEYYFVSFVSSAFWILYFLNLKCKNKKAEDWYYNWIGIYSTYFIYVIHWIVKERLDKLYLIEIPVVKPLLVLLISFVIYEIVFLLFKLGKYTINKIKNHKKETPILVEEKEL